MFEQFLAWGVGGGCRMAHMGLAFEVKNEGAQRMISADLAHRESILPGIGAEKIFPTPAHRE